jgi:NADH:ubiquinone oxidoreductase subunit F (NADH-binding)
MSSDPFARRLLAGPLPQTGPEPYRAHVERLGPVPRAASREVVDRLEASGLLGRGGAGFPTGRKWRSLAERSHGQAVVLANGAEGEPRSGKDRVLMSLRPHLVLDGAILAAEAIGADEIVVYIGVEHRTALATMRRAIAERSGTDTPPIRLAPAPLGYVSGEASAAVQYVNRGDARPTSSPPRPSQRGVHGRPTLVQNVETLAYAALIARFGDTWYRSAGDGETGGTALVTVSGPTPRQGVIEIELGSTIGDVARVAGARSGRLQAVLLGGYFGSWSQIGPAWDLPLDPPEMRRRGLEFGCGMVSFLPIDECGVTATARIMGFMARSSAGQCGPCVFGLPAIAHAVDRLASGVGGMAEIADMERWTGQVVGRGACHHPDGAAGLMTSALATFADEFSRHARTRRCSVTGARVDAA